MAIKWLRSHTSPSVAELPAAGGGDGAVTTSEQEEQLLEMSFLDHLEELRWSIIKGLASLVIVTVVASFFSEFILQEILLGPTHKDFFMYRLLHLPAIDITLQSRNPTGQFFAYWGTIVAVGLVLGSPLVVYFLWKFIEPGLYRHERQGMRFAAVFATLFFIMGLCFGFLILTPLALQFFAGFQIGKSVVNEFDIARYFDMVVAWTFGVGLLFELPVVMYFLAKLGVVTAAVLRKVRSYALIVALILAAIFTPPDVISQLLVTAPLLLLYEVSIVIVAGVERHRARREAAEAAKQAQA